MKSETLLVDPVLTAAYVLKLEARISRLRAMIRELDGESASEYGEAPADDHRLEKLYYPTIERGDMTEE